MKHNYNALLQGGLGPDVWDKELQISAVDIQDALNQAKGTADEMGGHVVMVEQNDWSEKIEGTISEVKRTLERLNHRVHTGYDFNADPDGMTLEVGKFLG